MKDRIIYEELIFPPDVHTSDESKDLIKKMLCKDPGKRIGALQDAKEIK